MTYTIYRNGTAIGTKTVFLQQADQSARALSRRRR
jgi:hypothetical protein